MIGTLLSNRYRIEAKLGEGGMGVVCKAHDTLLDRPVAIKSLSPQLFSKEGLKRLLREAQSAAKLAHPNIVATHDVLEDGDSRHIVMEFVEGKTLRDFIPMPWRDAVPLMRQVFEAIEFAHEHGIIHRDLSMYARWKAGKRPTPEPMEWAPDTNVFDVADQIRCPILLAYGALEPERFRSQAEELAAVVPTAIVRPWRSGVHALPNVPEALDDAAEWMRQHIVEGTNQIIIMALELGSREVVPRSNVQGIAPRRSRLVCSSDYIDEKKEGK